MQSSIRQSRGQSAVRALGDASGGDLEQSTANQTFIPNDARKNAETYKKDMETGGVPGDFVGAMIWIGDGWRMVKRRVPDVPIPSWSLIPLGKYNGVTTAGTAIAAKLEGILPKFVSSERCDPKVPGTYVRVNEFDTVNGAVEAIHVSVRTEESFDKHRLALDDFLKTFPDPYLPAQPQDPPPPSREETADPPLPVEEARVMLDACPRLAELFARGTGSADAEDEAPQDIGSGEMRAFLSGVGWPDSAPLQETAAEVEQQLDAAVPSPGYTSLVGMARRAASTAPEGEGGLTPKRIGQATRLLYGVKPPALPGPEGAPQGPPGGGGGGGGVVGGRRNLSAAFQGEHTEQGPPNRRRPLGAGSAGDPIDADPVTPAMWQPPTSAGTPADRVPSLLQSLCPVGATLAEAASTVLIDSLLQAEGKYTLDDLPRDDTSPALLMRAELLIRAFWRTAGCEWLPQARPESLNDLELVREALRASVAFRHEAPPPPPPSSQRVDDTARTAGGSSSRAARELNAEERLRAVPLPILDRLRNVPEILALGEAAGITHLPEQAREDLRTFALSNRKPHAPDATWESARIPPALNAFCDAIYRPPGSYTHHRDE